MQDLIQNGQLFITHSTTISTFGLKRADHKL